MGSCDIIYFENLENEIKCIEDNIVNLSNSIYNIKIDIKKILDSLKNI